MERKKYGIFHQIMAAVLCLALLVPVVAPAVNAAGTAAANAAPVPANNQVLATVFAASDFQPKVSGSDPAVPDIEGGKATMNAIIDAMQAAGYTKVDGALIAGDYTATSGQDNTDTAKAGLDAVYNVLTSQWPTLNAGNSVFVQGNHDSKSYLTANSHLDPSGANDQSAYGVYVIHEDDFPFKSGASNDTDGAIAQATAAALESYLADKVENKYGKPVFVVSHVPLHYTYRTMKSNTFDNVWAKYIFDVLNKYGEQLNIFFLFGHNHSNDYDNYVGGSAIYMTEGDSLLVPNLGSASTFTEYTLNFTYMNTGYVGYEETTTDVGLSSTIFSIYGDRVEIKRYGYSDSSPKAVTQVKLKDTGLVGANDGECGLTGYTTGYSYTSPQSVKLKNFDVELKLGTLAAGVLNKGSSAQVSVFGESGVEYAVEWSTTSAAAAVNPAADGMSATVTGVADGTVTLYANVTDPYTGSVVTLAYSFEVQTDTPSASVSLTTATSNYTYFKKVDSVDYDGVYMLVDMEYNGPVIGDHMALTYNGTVDEAREDDSLQDATVPRELNAAGVEVFQLPINGTTQTLIYSTNTNAQWKFIETSAGMLVRKNVTATPTSTDYRFLSISEGNKGYNAQDGDHDRLRMLLRSEVRNDGNTDWGTDSNYTWYYSKTYGLRSRRLADGYQFALYYSQAQKDFSAFRNDHSGYHNADSDAGDGSVHSDEETDSRVYLFQQVTGTLGELSGYVTGVKGYVNVNVAGSAQTGDHIVITAADGTTMTVPVTVDMLSGTYDLTKPGTYSGLTVKYGDNGSGSTMTVATGYTLVVRDSVTLIKNDAAREYMDTLYTLVETEFIPGRQYLIVDSNEAGIAHAMGVESRTDSDNRVYGYNVLVQSLPVAGQNVLYIDSSRYGKPADATENGLIGSGIRDQGDVNAYLATSDRETEEAQYAYAIRLVWTPTKRIFPYQDIGVEYFDVRNDNWNFIMSEMANARDWDARYLKITADAEDNQLGLFDTPATGTSARWWYQWRYGESGMHLYRGSVGHSELFYNYQNIVYAPNTSSTTDSNSNQASVENNPANKNFQTEREVHVENSTEHKAGFNEAASSKGDATNRRVYIYQRVTNIDTISARLSDLSGSVTEDRNASALTGDYILVDTTYADGTVSTEQIAISTGMLSGGSLDLEQPGTYTGITVTYQGVVLTDSYSLTVNELVVDDYPDFPDEGAVRIDKTLNTNTYNYMNTGAATIDLSVSGIPAQTGVDLVMILDTSSSMTKCLHGLNPGEDCPHDNTSAPVGQAGSCPIRITVLENTLETVLAQLQKPVNGYVPDIEVAIATFNGYTPINTDYEMEYIQAGDATNRENSQTANEENWDYSQVLLGFTPVKDIEPSAFNANQATTGAGQDIETSRGTNYDRGMELAYDLIKEKQDRNTANGVTRDSVVIFMSDGLPYQYNYFQGDPNIYAWDEFVTGMLDEVQAAVNAGNGATTNVSVSLGGTTLTIDKRQKEASPAYSITAAELAAYIPTDPTVKAIFDKYYHNDGKLWMAEAIKGDANSLYKIIDPDAMTADHITQVRGLGAKLYTIGFGIDNEGGDGEAEEVSTAAVAGELIDSGSDGQYVLKNIATDPSYFHNAVDQAGLTEAFSRITQQMLSAGDAVFTDRMGAMFDLITSNQRQVGGVVGTLTFDPAPAITVKSYETYKRSEIGQYLTFTGSDGAVTTVYVTESMVGTHKPVAPAVIEVVTFNEDGTAAYSTVDVDGDGLSGKDDNILEGDVIHAATFYYNTDISNAEKVTVNGAEVMLETESFYWIVGDIPQDELVLSYNIYLTGSMEGTRGAGTYDTNDHAELNYTNYLNNACVLTVPTPVLPWQQATVGYGFYLVDQNGNPIINQTTGETGSFEQAVRLTQPIYRSFMLNNESGKITADELSAAATQAGYALYDSAAAYEVTLTSGGAGTYTITAAGGLKQTSYVVGVADTAVTGGDADGESFNTGNYATINTVVWFAVNATVGCAPDVIVIDYGLPTDIHPLVNDLMMPTGTVTLKYLGLKDQFTGTKTMLNTADGLKFGSARITDDGTVNSYDAAVRYTLDTMQMGAEETFYYAVDYTGPVGTNGLYYSSVTVIPATTIYYEDSFVDYKTYQYISDSDYPKTDTEHYRGTVAGEPLQNDLWTTVTSQSLDRIQGEDRPGSFSLSYIDANNIYGYDGAYKNLTTYSMGSAMKFTTTSVPNSGTRTIVNANGKTLENVDMTGTYTKTYGTAEFTFDGTGFDVVSVTSNTTGFIVIQVYAVNDNGTETLKKATMVDTYYGYKYVDGKWVVDTEAANSLYQVPVIKISGLDYGKYRALITVSYNDAFDHNPADNTSGGQYDFYLDAIRIYDPADDGNNSEVIRDAYVSDGEGWPEYFELRNMVIKKNTFDALDSDAIAGIVFIDNTDAANHEPTVSDYTNFGPNNELYLAPGQAVTFTLNVGGDVAAIHLALKTVGCGSNDKVYTKIHNVANMSVPYSELTTATDLYHNITVLNGKTVLISNSADSDAIVSITNIKVTYNTAHQDSGALLPSEPASTAKFVVSRGAVEQAKNALLYAQEHLQVEKPEQNPGTGDEMCLMLPLMMVAAVLGLSVLTLGRRKCE